MTTDNSFKASEIDEKFDNGEDVSEYFDLEHPIIMQGISQDEKDDEARPTGED